MLLVPFRNVPYQETRDVSRWRDISTAHRLGKQLIHLELKFVVSSHLPFVSQFFSRQTRGGNTHRMRTQLFKPNSLNLSDL
jgi:hypothetical protein